MVNIFAAVLLGPGWGVGIAFCASLLRNILGIGSLMAFPGSMIGALCCGLVYKKCKNLSLTCLAEALGTGILGGIAAYPVALFLMGAAPAGLFIYVIPFLISTVAGSILAFLLISVFQKSGVMAQLFPTSNLIFAGSVAKQLPFLSASIHMHGTVAFLVYAVRVLLTSKLYNSHIRMEAKQHEKLHNPDGCSS